MLHHSTCIVHCVTLVGHGVPIFPEKKVPFLHEYVIPTVLIFMDRVGVVRGRTADGNITVSSIVAITSPPYKPGGHSLPPPSPVQYHPTGHDETPLRKAAPRASSGLPVSAWSPLAFVAKPLMAGSGTWYPSSIVLYMPVVYEPASTKIGAELPLGQYTFAAPHGTCGRGRSRKREAREGGSEREGSAACFRWSRVAAIRRRLLPFFHHPMYVHRVLPRTTGLRARIYR